MNKNCLSILITIAFTVWTVLFSPTVNADEKDYFLTLSGGVTYAKIGYPEGRLDEYSDSFRHSNNESTSIKLDDEWPNDRVDTTKYMVSVAYGVFIDDTVFYKLGASAIPAIRFEGTSENNTMHIEIQTDIILFESQIGYKFTDRFKATAGLHGYGIDSNISYWEVQTTGEVRQKHGRVRDFGVGSMLGASYSVFNGWNIAGSFHRSVGSKNDVGRADLWTVKLEKEWL
jgi:hypothetical protein